MDNLISILFGVILLSPAWIWIVSRKPWQVSTKKIAIVTLATLSTAIFAYGFLRPHGNFSPVWMGQFVLVLFFIAVAASVYFYWPREQKSKRCDYSENPVFPCVTKKSVMKGEIKYVVIPSMTGTDHDALVTFIDAIFQEVQEANKTFKRYPDPDFGAWLLDEIYNKKKILVEGRGVFRKRFFCPSCGAELSLELKTPIQIEFELKYKNFNPFVMQITLPSVVCPQCNKISGADLDGSLADHLNEAIIAAFRSESIKP